MQKLPYKQVIKLLENPILRSFYNSLKREVEGRFDHTGYIVLRNNTFKNMQLLSANSRIFVQQYRFGQPFPGLISEVENFTPLPAHSLTVPGHYDNGMQGKYGIVQTSTQGIIVVSDYEYLQISGGPMGGLALNGCIGRLPIGYQVGGM